MQDISDSENPKKMQNKRIRKKVAKSEVKKAKRDKKRNPHNCSEPLPNGRRCEINDYFWNMTRDEQTTWIAHMVETTTPVRPRKKTLRKKERNFTRIFYLEAEGKNIDKSMPGNVSLYIRSSNR